MARGQPTGWIPPGERSSEVKQAHEEALRYVQPPPSSGGAAPAAALSSDQAERLRAALARPLGPFLLCVLGSIIAGKPLLSAILDCLGEPPVPPPVPPPAPDVKRAALWKLAQQAYNGPLPYNWQKTGSCVGAGGGNMLSTLIGVEIQAGEHEVIQAPWWLYTYGQSRARLGLDSEGEGSTGAAWAAEIQEGGIFSLEEIPEVGNFTSEQGWRSVSSRTELAWSVGQPWKDRYGARARLHPVKGVRHVASADQAGEELRNGRPITMASMFGSKTIRPRGNPVVNIAEYDDEWSHQMFIDEVWDHPTEGTLYRVGNNWGPSAHPAPKSGEPAGGFYITKATLERILREDSEVYAYDGFGGFQARPKVQHLLRKVQQELHVS